MWMLASLAWLAMLYLCCVVLCCAVLCCAMLAVPMSCLVRLLLYYYTRLLYSLILLLSLLYPYLYPALRYLGNICMHANCQLPTHDQVKLLWTSLFPHLSSHLQYRICVLPSVIDTNSLSFIFCLLLHIYCLLCACLSPKTRGTPKLCRAVPAFRLRW